MKGQIFKLKKDKLETWKAWCLEINQNRKDEALETLKEEGLNREYGGILNINGDWYGFIFADKEGKPSDKSKEINRTHLQKFLECVDDEKGSRARIETLYSLEINHS